jgi:hypothetical protein
MRPTIKDSTKGRQVNTAHHFRQSLDPLRADWTYRVYGDPEVQDDGFIVYDARSGAEDSWHRWAVDAERRKWELRDEQYAAMRADQAKHCPSQARLLEDPHGGEDEEIAIDRLSAEWDCNRETPDWAAERLADLYARLPRPGDPGEPFEILADSDWRARELYEAGESDRLLSLSLGWGRASRVDAEEEARLYGWGR